MNSFASVSLEPKYLSDDNTQYENYDFMIQGVFFIATTILGLIIYLYKKHKKIKLQ